VNIKNSKRKIAEDIDKTPQKMTTSNTRSSKRKPNEVIEVLSESSSSSVINIPKNSKKHSTKEESEVTNEPSKRRKIQTKNNLIITKIFLFY